MPYWTRDKKKHKFSFYGDMSKAEMALIGSSIKEKDIYEKHGDTRMHEIPHKHISIHRKILPDHEGQTELEKLEVIQAAGGQTTILDTIHSLDDTTTYVDSGNYMSNIMHEYDSSVDDTITWGICDANTIKTSFVDPGYILPESRVHLLNNNPLINPSHKDLNVDIKKPHTVYGFLMWLFTNHDDTVGVDYEDNAYTYSHPKWVNIDKDWSCYLFKIYQAELNKVLGLESVQDAEGVDYIINGADLYYSSANSNIGYHRGTEENKAFSRKIMEYRADSTYSTIADVKLGYINKSGTIQAPFTTIDIGASQSFMYWWFHLDANMSLIPKHLGTYYHNQQAMAENYRLKDLIALQYYDDWFSFISASPLFLIHRDENAEVLHSLTHLDLPFMAPSIFITSFLEILHSAAFTATIIPNLICPPRLIGLERSICHEASFDPQLHLIATVYNRNDEDPTHANPYYTLDKRLILIEMEDGIDTPSFDYNL